MMPMSMLIGLGAAVVTYMVVGFLWYSPMLFGKMWMASVGKGMQDCKMTWCHLAQCACIALVFALVLSQLLMMTGAQDLVDAARLGGMLGAVVAAAMYSSVIWAGKNMTTYLIDASCMVVELVLMAVLLAMLG